MTQSTISPKRFRGFPLQELGTGNLVGNLARSCPRNQGPDLVPGLFYFTPKTSLLQEGCTTSMDLDFLGGSCSAAVFEEFLLVECSQCSVPAAGFMAKHR